MPQFRQNFITKEWVIVAPERSRRPDQFVRQTNHDHAELPAHDPGCPFCSGNESMTPPPSFVNKGPEGWRLRVVPNKFAAVNPELSPERRNDGLFLSAAGFGVAEVIIEHPAHNTTLALMTSTEVENVVSAYKQRFGSLAADPHIDLITIFRNHGRSAGTSLIHPHSQVIATPIVPPHVRHLMQQAIIYHDTHGTCPYCDMMKEELSQGVRIVMETPHHIAYCPWASRSPFETWIMPRRHYSRFDAMSEEETSDLAGLLRRSLLKLHRGLGDPDHNIVISTSPTSDGEVHYDHWRLNITPRLTTAAGFELGSGIFINTMPPEDAAAFLRDVPAE